MECQDTVGSGMEKSNFISCRSHRPKVGTQNFAALQHIREIQEKEWRYMSKKLHATQPLMERLGLSKKLEGHGGCVNCLDFSSDGRLLLSGSDDFSIILWDVYKKKFLTKLNTGHGGNIFTVKFLPETNNKTIVSGAADCRVEVQELDSGELLQVCTCHTMRVKRIATIPSCPNIFLSASEDGTIMQFDTRVKHECSSHPNNVLVNLKQHAGKGVECKCVTVNPMRSELVAVGASDPYIRVYDRRMIKLTSVQYPPGPSRTSWERANYAISQMDLAQDNLSPGCVQYYVPGHLPSKMKEYYHRFRSIAITYLSYSTNGTHLLANLGGDHIYLFDTIHGEKPKQYSLPSKNGFCETMKEPPARNGFNQHNYSDGVVVNNDKGSQEQLPERLENIRKAACQEHRNQDYSRALELYNQAIQGYSGSASLHVGRAASLMRRDWDGDVYAALRDCDRAIYIDPLNVRARCRLIKCLHLLGRCSEANHCIETFEKQNAASLKLNDCSSWCDLKEWMSKPSQNESSEEEDGDDDAVINLSQPSSPYEKEWRLNAKDYEKVFCGHCNTTTDIKEAVFVGQNAQFIAAGSDDGNLFIWNKDTTNLVRVIVADTSIVNCVQAHPNICLLATSGIESVVKLWEPLGADELPASSELNFNSVTSGNQHRMSTDPVEMMILQMGDFSQTFMNGGGPGPSGQGVGVSVRFPSGDDSPGGPNTNPCRQS